MTRSERIFACTLFLLLLSTISASGQLCYLPKYERTLACVPTLTADSQTFGVGVQFVSGNQGLITQGSVNNITIDELPFAAPIGIAAQYASQISSAPSAATSAGFILSMKGGAPDLKPADLGPLFSDLPQTLGRHRLYVGASYQFLQFTKIGGRNINSFNYTQYYGNDYYSEENPYGTSNTPLLGTNNLLSSASLKVHEINTYVSFGITDKIEISAVIPFSKVLFSFNSACSSNYDNFFTFTNVFGTGTTDKFCATENLTPQNDIFGYGPNTYGFFLFPSGVTAMSSTVAEPNSTENGFGPEGLPSTAKGLGDITLRGKWEFKKREHDGAAVGLEVRFPSGDPLNFKGTGATGVRPFLAYAYNAKFSPHVNIGYQYNGSSINDVRDRVTYNNTSGNSDQGQLIFATAAAPTKLPNAFTATFGLDYGTFKWMNLDADFLLRAFSNNDMKAFAAPTCSGCPNVGTGGTIPLTGPVAPGFTGTSVKTTLVFGSKFKLANHLLLAANVMVDANPGSGLSYKPSPLVNLSYDFGVTQK